jgi:hypothetical protein
MPRVLDELRQNLHYGQCRNLFENGREFKRERARYRRQLSLSQKRKSARKIRERSPETY